MSQPAPDNSLSPPCEAYAGGDPFIFLSYAHKDSPLVYPEIARLRRLGFRLWYDEGIRPSSDWPDEVASALNRCSLFLVFLSPHAVGSRNVLNEIYFALEHNKPFLAVHLSEVILPDSLQLQVGRIQAIVKHRMTEEHYQAQLSRWLPSTLASAPAENVAAAQQLPPPSRPAVQVPSFHYGGVVPPEFFIGREDELEEATRHIRAGQGFLLVGNRRAGKTSFCTKLIHQIMGSPGNDILSAYLNLQQCVQLTIETFLEHTLLSIIGEMARQVFHCRYSDLLHPNPAERNEAFRKDPEFLSFVEVVSRVIERTHTQQGAGPSPLLASEFIQFSHDLFHILRAKKWRRCVVFYDEANRLPDHLSVDLLLSNEETLSRAGLATVYAASPEMAESIRALRDVCGQDLPLGPFRSPQDLRRLLECYYFAGTVRKDELPAEPAALELIWRLTQGMPYAIQLLAGQSFRLARSQSSPRVTAAHVEQSFAMLRQDKPYLFPAG